MKVLCLVVALISAFGTLQARIFDPRENDINYKRFQQLINRHGDVETIDLLEGDVTVRASASDVSYYLYTRNNQNDPHIVKTTNAADLSKSQHFDPKKNTVVIIHGWVDSYTADVNRLVKAAVLSKRDVNILVVDWSPVAAGSYSTAQAGVVPIGEFVGNFINGIIDTFKVTGSQLTIIGHSLGAHIAGNAGQVIKSKVSHIIGLDPAAPSFTVANTNNRLDPSDATYVQVIHTNSRLLGFSSSIGHADYYPNGGAVQNGCGLDLLGGCSHARSFEYLTESVNTEKFTATACGSQSDYTAGKCNSNKKARLGSLDVDSSVKGDFFVDTNSAAPFAKG